MSQSSQELPHLIIQDDYFTGKHNSTYGEALYRSVTMWEACSSLAVDSEIARSQIGDDEFGLRRMPAMTLG